MIPRSPLRLSLLGPLVLVLALVGVVPAQAAGGGPGPDAGARAVTEKVQRVRVLWQGFQAHPTYVKSAVVPGIGNLKLVCKPNLTIVRLFATDRHAETQMWMSKYETKNGHDVVAVKNVRIYTYANANDDGSGGTGASAHEGLNQRTPIEDFAQGHADGVISQRVGRNKPAAGTLTAPVTSFRLSWYWERMAYAGSQYCKINMVLRTVYGGRIGINWHGDDDAADHSTTSTGLPGFGDVDLLCETTRGGEQTVALAPAAYDPDTDPEPHLAYEYVTGEGAVEDHVETGDLGYDDVTGLLGPLELPRNGMMRLWFTVDGFTRGFGLSSYMITNNAAHPELNLCEVAVAELPPGSG
ncbi:MAG: hypothetical protein JWO76_1657 [Nocardioides sp.]|nr:hypothetical protein [Nocardioides sp.]